MIEKVSSRDPKSKMLDISACGLDFIPDMLYTKFPELEYDLVC